MEAKAFTRFETFLAKIKAEQKSILVLGDRMRDVYHHGTFTRVAPEAGAPVFVAGAHPVQVPGGSANVAEQLKTWNILTREIHTDTTSTKVRFVVDDRLWMRWDEEHHVRPLAGEWSLECLPDVATALVGDYAKGTITREMAHQVVKECASRGIPLIVDPSPEPIDNDAHWYGASVIKMNANQWARRKASPQAWRHDHAIDTLVITHGASSPRVYDQSGAHHIPTHGPAVQAVDTAGAGDHFAAVLAVGIAHGLPITEACEFAHLASKIRVTRRRPALVHPQECLALLDPVRGKILEAMDINRLLTTGKQVVFTNGVFDPGVHPGHATLFEWAKRQGDILIVGVNSDVSATFAKGLHRPLMPVEQRAYLIASQAAVDYVVIYDEPTPVETIQTLGSVDILVKGDEFRDQHVPGDHLVTEVRYAPTVFWEHASDWIRKAREVRV